MNSYPTRLFDVRSAISAGDWQAAVWLIVNNPVEWSRWLSVWDLAELRRLGCPEWAINPYAPDVQEQQP